jgi:uncharacterized protein
MEKDVIVEKTKGYVKQELSEESTGHDWFHSIRVYKNALLISENEVADSFTIQMAALLHDIADHKFHSGDYTVGSKIARDYLRKMLLHRNDINHICNIIETISFSKGKTPQTIEGKIVQDADRLDALGAIGIARAFAYGGFKQREIYNPEIKPNIFDSFDEYKKSNGPTINHFYEKLLLLKDKMNTETGKKIAEERHSFLLTYLEQFIKEWKGLS